MAMVLIMRTQGTQGIQGSPSAGVIQSIEHQAVEAVVHGGAAGGINAADGGDDGQGGHRTPQNVTERSILGAWRLFAY